MTADLSRQTREELAAIAHDEAVAQADFDLICDDYPKLLSERDALAASVDALQEALREVRKDVIAAHYAGWDSERKKLAETAVDRIDAVLASAVPADGENA